MQHKTILMENNKLNDWCYLIVKDDEHKKFEWYSFERIESIRISYIVDKKTALSNEHIQISIWKRERERQRKKNLLTDK